jgi:hypothetical protein
MGEPIGGRSPHRRERSDQGSQLCRGQRSAGTTRTRAGATLMSDGNSNQTPHGAQRTRPDTWHVAAIDWRSGAIRSWRPPGPERVNPDHPRRLLVGSAAEVHRLLDDAAQLPSNHRHSRGDSSQHAAQATMVTLRITAIRPRSDRLARGRWIVRRGVFLGEPLRAALHWAARRYAMIGLARTEVRPRAAVAMATSGGASRGERNSLRTAPGVQRAPSVVPPSMTARLIPAVGEDMKLPQATTAHRKEQH